MDQIENLIQRHGVELHVTLSPAPQSGVIFQARVIGEGFDLAESADSVKEAIKALNDRIEQLAEAHADAKRGRDADRI